MAANRTRQCVHGILFRCGVPLVQSACLIGVRGGGGGGGGGVDRLISFEQSSFTSVRLCTTRDDVVDDGKTLAVNYYDV